ncbi:MAG: hypothetical protein IIC67_04545, partial [Thaumarchaeota archaeon]|nr:hypothetical protein [Nitrososphaerota archaeon]
VDGIDRGITELSFRVIENVAIIQEAFTGIFTEATPEDAIKNFENVFDGILVGLGVLEQQKRLEIIIVPSIDVEGAKKRLAESFDELFKSVKDSRSEFIEALSKVFEIEEDDGGVFGPILIGVEDFADRLKGTFKDIDLDIIPESLIAKTKTRIVSIDDALIKLDKSLAGLFIEKTEGGFFSAETSARILADQAQVKALNDELEKLKQRLLEAGFVGVPGKEKPDKPEDEREPFSPLTGFAASLFGFTDATNTALEDFEEDFGASAGAIELIATGMEDVLSEVSAAVVGGFIDQAIAGDFSAKALAASAFKALSGVLKAVAIEATIKGFLALSEGLAGDTTKFAAAASFFKTAALAGVGAIAAGIVGKALAPRQEERERGGFDRGRRFGGGPRIDEMPISEQIQRRQGEINITVFGFVGNEQELGAKLGSIIRQATNDDVDFGVNVELA